MARTYTREQINQMGPGEKAMALEIDAFEAQEETRLAQQVDTPSQEAVEEFDAPEIQEQPVSTPEVPVVEAKDVEFWKKKAEEREKEAENWKKRQGDALKALTPAQQEAAELRRTNAALEARLEALASKMDSVLQQTSQPRHTEVDADDAEFNETYPEISKQANKTAKREAELVRRELEERIKKSELVQQELSSIKESIQQREQEAAILQHFNEVKSVHSDAELFFNHVLGPAFTEWASTQSPMIERIATSPMSAASKDVAYVISQFKADTGLNKKTSQPSLGDRMTKAMNAPPIPVVAKEADLLSDHEMKNIESLLAKNGSNPKEQDRLLDAYERTLIQQSKRR